MEFFAALAALSFSLPLEAVSIEAGDPSIDLAEQFLVSTLFPGLLNSEQLFSAFIDRLPGYAWIKNVEGSYVYINEQLRQLPPYQSDCVGKTDEDLWPPELAAVYRENDLKVIATREKVEAVESFVLNGKQYHQLVSKFPIFNKDGKVIMVGGTSVDITEHKAIEEALREDMIARKRADQALRQAEQKYRELFENAKDATYVHDLSGRYTSINRAAEKLTGYSREEILGKNFSSFVAPEDAEHVRENLFRKLREEGETTYEVEVITKDGRRVPVEVSSRLIYEEGVPIGVQGTARNIFERKRAEEALRGYSRQLIRAQEAERQSIARELHDQIGQVLTAIRINLKTVRDSANRVESNALIDEGVTIVDEAIQQVRDLSFELRPSLLDDLGLTAALRWYADRFTQRTGIHTQTSIFLESRNRLPRELETACFRIVQEALTNVARHAQAKNVFVSVRTVKGAISLSIKDDGIGFKSHSQANGELPGSLGFRGMEERAHELGGKLEINSAPHKGTEVEVHFPNGSKRKELT